MATFRKGHYARTILTRKIQVGTTTNTQPTTKITWYLDPSDTLTLRGIPAIGRGVAGAMHGTRPDTRQEPT